MKERFLSQSQSFIMKNLGFEDDCLACYILDENSKEIEMNFNLLSNQYTLHPSLKGRTSVNLEILKWIKGVNAYAAPLKDQALIWLEKNKDAYASVDWEEREGELVFFIKWVKEEKNGRYGEYKTHMSAFNELINVILDVCSNLKEK